jgi:micrococcal nuclease
MRINQAHQHLLLPIALLLTLTPIALIRSAIAQTTTAIVISVGDGDTIRVRTEVKTLTVRLACIDAPESGQAPYGQTAANRLKQLLPVGTSVNLRVADVDRYGRSVAKIYKGELSINTIMVQEGHAAVYSQYLSACPDLREKLRKAEASAKASRRGLWVQANPVMPWDFRRAAKVPGVKPAKTTRRPAAEKGHNAPVQQGQGNSRIDWSRAQQDINSGRYSTGVNSAGSSDPQYGGSYSGGSSSSGGSCDYAWQTDSAGRSCGGRAAGERPGGK